MGTMVMMVGLPGSGKSTWLAKNPQPGVRLSLDDFRKLMTGRDYHAPFEPIATSWLESTGRYLMSQGVSIVIDATSLRYGIREKWCRIAKEHGFKTRAIVVNPPAEIAWERNEKRERYVPRDVWDRMVSEFQMPSEEEGFDEITIVENK